jgi:hypothetical protein
VLERFELPLRLGSFGLTEESVGIVAAFELLCVPCASSRGNSMAAMLPYLP